MKTTYHCEYCDFSSDNLEEVKEHEMNCEKELKDLFFYILDDTEKEFHDTISKVGIDKFLTWVTEWEDNKAKTEVKPTLEKEFEEIENLFKPMTIELKDVKISDDFEKLLGKIIN